MRMKTILAFAVAVSFMAMGAIADAKYVKKEPKMPKKPYKEAAAGPNTVSGTVKWAGPVPEPKPFTITKNPEVCAKLSPNDQQYSKDGKRFFHFTQVKNDATQHVVVFLEGVEAGKPWGDFAKTLPIRGQDCAFLEYINLIRDGTTEFKAVNLDPVLHNPHTFYFAGLARKTFFNQPLNPKGEAGDSLDFKFDDKLAMERAKARIFKLECDQHDFMHAWGWNASNPYATIVAEDGSYALDGVPDGKFDLCAWHPESGLQCDEIEVSGGAVTHDFTVCDSKDMKKGCS